MARANVVSALWDIDAAKIAHAAAAMPGARRYRVDVTPPVGNCLYLGVVLARSSLWEVTKAALPFLLVNVLVLLLVTYVPAVSVWLPSLFFEGSR
jgi:hypothetical protein